MYSFVNKLKTGSHYCQPIITTCCGQIMIHKKNNLKDFFVKTIKNKRTKRFSKLKNLKFVIFWLGLNPIISLKKFCKKT